MTRHPLEVVFAVGLCALPPGPLRRLDRAEMQRTLRDQLDEARLGRERWRVGGRAIGRLPGVVVAEWLDWLGVTGSTRGPSIRGEGDGMLRSALGVVRFAGRSLRKSPTFALASVLLVALGVGAVTTVFTVVDHVLLRPLPYPAADRLVYLTNGAHNGATLARLDGVDAFELWTATSASSVNLTRADGDPRRLRRVEVTPEFFTLFAARPQLGRLLIGSDRDRVDVAVLSHPFWRDAFGGDPNVVGRTMQIDGTPIEIVGVLGPDFVQPSRLGDPAHFYRPVDWSNPGFQNPGYHAHSVTARLAPGVTIEQADQQTARVAADVAAAHPDQYSDEPPRWPLANLHATTVEHVRGGLLLLLAAVGMLLLVGCANVAHLFLARGLSRSAEMAIRSAMGARTRNLLAQLAAESILVGALGGIGGATLAWAGLAAFEGWTTELPRGSEIALDLRVLSACIGLATLTALVCGLLPAFRASGRDVQEGLRAGTRSASGSRRLQALRSALVVFEVAISLVLVASAGLLMRSFLSVTAIDPGVDVEDVWVVTLNPTNVESPDQYRGRMTPIRDALLDIPGVTQATYGIELPFEHVGGDQCCWSTRMPPPEEPEGNPVRMALHPVSEGFFETLGTATVAGRTWTRGEATADPAPIVVTETLATRFFGSPEAALGRSLTELTGGPGIVVGVVADTRHYGLDQPHDYGIYVPMERLPFPISRASFALRAPEASSDFGRRVREAVWSVEADLPVPEVTTLAAWVTGSSATRRFGSLIFSVFGAVALLLAAAGLYGTLLYAVGQRRRELGIRLALGAGRSRIQGEVVRRGVAHAALGIFAGGLATVWVGRLLEQWLFGVSGTDAPTLASAAGVLFLTAVGASWLPAYRAGRTDPLETLKAE